MSPLKSTKKLSQTRLFLALATVVIVISSVFYIHWQSMNQNIPNLASLKELRVNGLRSVVSRSKGGSNYSIEFFDPSGRRYQTPWLSNSQYLKLTKAYDAKTSITVKFGKWNSVIPSTKIFSIYQIESAGEKIFEYSTALMSNNKKKNQASYVIITSILAIILGFFL